MGKVLSARQTILNLVSFKGYLSIPNAARFIRYHKNRWDHRHVVIVNKTASRSSSDPVSERSDDLVTRRLGQESLGSDKKDENDRLTDLPIWSEDFKTDLESTEMHASAHVSQAGTSYESGNEIK